MRRFILNIIIMLIAGLLSSCGKGDPARPELNSMNRAGEDFAPPQIIFSPTGLNGPFYDADLSEIIVGPPNGSGQLWLHGDQYEEHYWSVAVALAEDTSDFGERTICLRFLTEDPTLMSPVLNVTNGIIRFARVAACYFSYTPDDLDHHFVEVTIVYQWWAPLYNKWTIRIARLGFDPDIFTDDIDDLPSIQPAWSMMKEYSEGANGYGLIMPDVAYDPRPGLLGQTLYVVFSYYETPNLAFIHGVTGILGSPPSTRIWSTNSTLCQGSTDCGFHPRIDIGKCGFWGADEEWTIAVAYTGANYYMADRFYPRLAYAPANAPGPGTIIDVALGPITPQLPPNGAMPIVDIGLPGLNYAAITWTQSRSESWNDVTVAVTDSRGLATDAFLLLNPAKGWISSASPSATVWDDDPSNQVRRVSISYLFCINPSSLSWNPRARMLTYDTTQNPSLFADGQALNVSNSLHGKWDSGSQYTNWYGLSTSITMDGYGSYWMLWSSWLQDGNQEGLTQIHGCHGYWDL